VAFNHVDETVFSVDIAESKPYVRTDAGDRVGLSGNRSSTNKA
jgi:hypothetical protein